MVAEKQAEIYKATSRYGASVHQAIRQTLNMAKGMLQIPKRFTGMMQSIWSLFYRLQAPQDNPARLERILGQRYVRAGVDFLELQTAAGWDYSESAAWWRKRLPKQQAFRPRGRSGPRSGPGGRSRRPRRQSRS